MTTRYTVTFVNWDGTVLSAAQYVEGTAASGIAVPADPTRPSDDSFRYIFVGWTPALAAVTADATYTATYVAEELSYFDVTFVDYDGTVLQATTSYADGTAVSDITVPADPTRAATTTHTYTFAGWDPPLGPVTADVTYTATYTEEPITYGKPAIELDHDLDYWEDADDYFVTLKATVTLNDVAGSTGQLKLMYKDPKTGDWEQVQFYDGEFGDAVLQLYTTQGGTRTPLTPSDPNATYDIPDDAEDLDVEIVKNISLYYDGDFAPRVREVVNLVFDYTLPNGDTGSVDVDKFYLYNDWFFGTGDGWEADATAKTLTLTFPYEVDRGGPLDYDNIYWHPHLYWQPADSYSYGATGTELDMTPEVTYYEEADGTVVGKIVYTVDTLVPNRAYDFE
ncbi:MAG: hypothetical protein IJH08_00880, partial [Atopobiaceae bacterium]|nr:hypothetical protein [Atopobiaceae bacterium]